MTKLTWLKRAADRPKGHVEYRDYGGEKAMIDAWVERGWVEIDSAPAKASRKTKTKEMVAPVVDRAIKKAGSKTKGLTD